MSKRGKGSRPKHVPKRTCIACRQVGGKRGLVRLVRTEQGVQVDSSGKLPGRGAYIHPSQECWKIALEGNRIQQALRTKLAEEDRQALYEYMRGLAVYNETVVAPDAVSSEDEVT